MVRRAFTGFHAAPAAYAEAGDDLGVEHILDDEGWREALIEFLQPFDIYLVGLIVASMS